MTYLFRLTTGGCLEYVTECYCPADEVEVAVAVAERLATDFEVEVRTVDGRDVARVKRNPFASYDPFGH